MKKQHVGQQAEHPIHVCLIPDNRATTGQLEKFLGEELSLAAFEYAAGGKVNEIRFSTKACEGIAKRLLADGFENRSHLSGLAVKGEIENRRICYGRVLPQQPVWRGGVVGEAALTFDKAMGKLQRRIMERRHGFKESLDGRGLEQPIVPIGFQTNKLGRNPPPAVDARPRRMAGARAGAEPTRCFLGADLDAAAAAHGAFAIVAKEGSVASNIVLPVTDVGRHRNVSVVLSPLLSP